MIGGLFLREYLAISNPAPAVPLTQTSMEFYVNMNLPRAKTVEFVDRFCRFHQCLFGGVEACTLKDARPSTQHAVEALNF